jgi:hemerythrin-like domain-containing protein
MTEAILEDLITSREDWDAKLALLKNHMEGHIAEEETSVFAIMQSAITTEQSEQMARNFLQQKGGFLPMHSVSDQPGESTSAVIL